MSKIIINMSVMISCCFVTMSCASVAPMSNANKNEILTVHNQLRKRHSAGALQWDNKLASFASAYASRCKLAHSHAGYGENLAAGHRSITAAIDAWYAEGARYSYKEARYTPGLGHFTQLVWKSTTRVGCGIAACNGKHGVPGNLLVCEYSPAGNVVNPGYFRVNVLPAK
jgi:uncharacterized protein YkwD